ncbi:hypothetical protein Y017_11370 [Alcanivorax sp. 97CO-5]|uniref:DUF262 domain-containing protein n=1 Tax=unclassified Alcanivorax TaxID=2638842 RepID=UPI0003E7F335|nr:MULTISPECIES: DUF262 domain-containing protein [unclassified Alcanivorax]EUC70014.1 hypothetical protein Y017_11370 [Alcanivorax sp. 97CO-5]PKG01796.1 DUF262 domain-containing protein [Alcanivorax sp. 97CO-6]
MTAAVENQAEQQAGQRTDHQVNTEVLTLEKVSKAAMGFVIPSYQRPYVWSDEDVIKLFDDIREAYVAEEEQYFIGSVLSAIHEKGESRLYELIDGQQRTTTLMLLSLAFRAAGVKTPLAQVSTLGEQPRLTFEIREAVGNLLGSYAGLERMTRPGPDAIEKDPYLTHLDANLRVLKQQVDGLRDTKDFNLEAFADYIYRKVSWVNNIVPESMDLNRLFASMNTAGIQLEPVDLLKAKLFRKITTEKPLYSAIWQACEHMENYFERNLRQLFPNADWNAIEYKHLDAYSGSLFERRAGGNEVDQSEASGKTLLHLLDEVESGDAPDNAEQKEQEDTQDGIEDETVYCRSIISFELLLIHTLRIFCASKQWEDIDARIKASNLMACFECLLSKDEADIKAFILTLWRVRYQFDTWVVKWVEHDDSEDPQLRLTNFSRSLSSGKYYINRSARELGELAQLQAVRNFTGDRSAHYWLTALLAQLVEPPGISDQEVLSVLERLDNQLSLTTETQKEASFKIARGVAPSMDSLDTIEAYLNSARGTGFEHYWFQKLEYLLWKRGDDDGKKKDPYRITSRNSVEHVHAQNERYGMRLESQNLDSFGNLVLLSPSENSSYGNLAVGQKKIDFEGKKRYDSLKLKAIFALYDQAGGAWGVKQIAEHQKQMITLLGNHYRQGGEYGQPNQ